MDSKIPSVAIVGRRNVGKSALFNRLIEAEKAIVSEIAGTTRDRTEGIGWWRGRQIKFIDTGGLDIGDKDLIEKEILKQVEFALQKSDLILFVVDLRIGLLPQEVKIAKDLQKYREKIIFVGNKADSPQIRTRADEREWLKLGLDAPAPVSAMTGAGVGDLLDMIFGQLNLVGPGLVPYRAGAAKAPKRPGTSPGPTALVGDDRSEGALRIAIIGRTNVGKSSLLNAIIGEKRVIVSPIPHTTREPQDMEIVFQGKTIILIDTAGLQKKTKIKEMERKGVERTIQIVKKADLVFFLIEPFVPLPNEDKRIASLISQSKTSVIILVNKWDAVSKENHQADRWVAMIKKELPQLNFAPIIFISALNALHVNKLLPLACRLFEERNILIKKEELTSLLPQLILRHKPLRGEWKSHPIIKRIEQTGTNPPGFTIWIGTKQSLHFAYVRFLENRLREYFGFEGSPIQIFVKQEKA